MQRDIREPVSILLSGGPYVAESEAQAHPARGRL